jgi:hypothetical protein
VEEPQSGTDPLPTSTFNITFPHVIRNINQEPPIRQPRAHLAHRREHLSGRAVSAAASAVDEDYAHVREPESNIIFEMGFERVRHVDPIDRVARPSAE